MGSARAPCPWGRGGPAHSQHSGLPETRPGLQPQTLGPNLTLPLTQLCDPRRVLTLSTLSLPISEMGGNVCFKEPRGLWIGRIRSAVGGLGSRLGWAGRLQAPRPPSRPGLGVLGARRLFQVTAKGSFSATFAGLRVARVLTAWLQGPGSQAASWSAQCPAQCPASR